MEAGVGGSEGPHPVSVQGQTGLSTAATAGKLPSAGCLLIMSCDHGTNMAACSQRVMTPCLQSAEHSIRHVPEHVCHRGMS